VSFLAICSYAILDTVMRANMQASYAARRALVMATLQDCIENVRGNAAGSSITAGTTTTPTTLPGFPSSVSVVTTITLRTNSLTLYDVSATATWTEQSSSGNRSDTATLASTVRL
jgi:hypothetical protein